MFTSRKAPETTASPGVAVADPAAPTGADKRTSKRIRTSLRTGQIYDMHNKLLGDCQIRDRSTGGAKLRLLSNMAVPTFFKLHDDVECTLIEVEMRWRNKQEIGVQFAGPWEDRLPSAKTG